MALTKTVTKKSVVSNQSGLYIITFNLSVSDGINIVVNQDFTCEYRTGENVSSKVNEIKEQMQKNIDNYKSSLVILNSAQLDTAVNNISGGLTV